MSVKSATAGTYTNTVAANALMTGPAGGNAAPATASLTVTAPSSSITSTGGSSSGGGGGALDWLEITLLSGVLLAAWRQAAGRSVRR
jgi:hypothetical protein